MINPSANKLLGTVHRVSSQSFNLLSYLVWCVRIYRERRALELLASTHLVDIGLSTAERDKEMAMSFFISRALFHARTRQLQNTNTTEGGNSWHCY